MGRLWQFRRVGNLINDGDCDAPVTPAKEIRVRSNLTGIDELETIIHECLHACCWFFREEFVLQLGKSLAVALWRLGYRKCE